MPPALPSACSSQAPALLERASHLPHGRNALAPLRYLAQGSVVLSETPCTRGLKRVRPRRIPEQSPANGPRAQSFSTHASAAFPPPICAADKEYAISNATKWRLSFHDHHPSARFPTLGFSSSRLLLLSR